MDSTTSPGFQIETPQAESVRAAFALMYQHLPTGERERCSVGSLELIEKGDLQIEDIFVAYDENKLIGMIVGTCNPGAAGQIWPPRVVDIAHRQELEDALVRSTVSRLLGQGAAFVQALVLDEDSHLAAALQRNGFHNPTALQTLQLTWTDSHPGVPSFCIDSDVRFVAYNDGISEMFAATLERTYQDSLDFPEFNGLRTIEQIRTGHKNHGVYDPDKWFLMCKDEQPAGVLILSEIPEWREWELAYIGVVPEFRGLGLGKSLVHKAIAESACKYDTLTVTVDKRNHIAHALYQRAGFELLEESLAWIHIKGD